MSLEHILLGMLREPATGYEIKRTFDEGFKYIWSAELAQIYPTLQGMERKRWLVSQRRASEKGPPRRVYRRTAKGNREFMAWLRREPIMGTERFAYLAQLIFHGELCDLASTKRFLMQLRAKQAVLRKLFLGVRKELTDQHPDGEATMDDTTFHDWICLEMGIRAVGARVRWCDRAIKIVSQRAARQERRKESRHD